MSIQDLDFGPLKRNETCTKIKVLWFNYFIELFKMSRPPAKFIKHEDEIKIETLQDIQIPTLNFSIKKPLWFRLVVVREKKIHNKFQIYQYRSLKWISIGNLDNKSIKSLAFQYSSQKLCQNIFLFLTSENYKNSIMFCKRLKQLRRLEVTLDSSLCDKKIIEFFSSFRTAKLTTLKINWVGTDILGPTASNMDYNEKAWAIFRCFSYCSITGNLKYLWRISRCKKHCQT